MSNNYIFLKYISLFILFSMISTRSFLENYKIKIDNKIFTRTEVYIEAQKIRDNIFSMGEVFIPSDLVTFLPPRTEFTIQILQGTIDSELKSQFYPFDFHRLQNLISDYPSGKIYYSKNFSPFEKEEEFKKYFDVFAHTFKLTLNPFFDRTSYITYENNKIMIDNKEIPCNTHLDAIKETLNEDKWKQFEEYVNYPDFSKSDFKSIKYHITNYQNKVVYEFEILSRDLNQTNIYFNKTNENFNNNMTKKQKIPNYEISNYITSKRYLDGLQISFDDFTLHHIITFPNLKILDEIIQKKKKLLIIELLPTKSMIPKYGTLKIKVYNKEQLIKTLGIEELIKYFEISISEKTEEKYPEIPFTYEKKISSQLNIQYLEGLIDFDKIEIEINLRKQILNFESIYNPQEFGFIFPCGIIIIGEEYTVTNHIYYNMPNVDVTMPFDIICLSWFVYGFMVVQILNIFLGKTKGKGILESVKDRFVTKWGWIWKKIY
jgi:hypothetical protein